MFVIGPDICGDDDICCDSDICCGVGDDVLDFICSFKFDIPVDAFSALGFKNELNLDKLEGLSVPEESTFSVVD